MLYREPTDSRVGRGYGRVMSDLPKVGDRRYFIEQHDDGGYLIRKYHTDTTIETFDTKEAAEKRAVEIAANKSSKNKRSQVKVRKGGTFDYVLDIVDGEVLNPGDSPYPYRRQ